MGKHIKISSRTSAENNDNAEKLNENGNNDQSKNEAKKDNNEKDEKINFIEVLFRIERDLCFQIFNKMDRKTLKSCRSVCKTWKWLIDEEYFKKITSNILNENFNPTTFKGIYFLLIRIH